MGDTTLGDLAGDGQRGGPGRLVSPVTGRLLVDLAEDGRVTVSALGDAAGALPEPGGSFPLDWSLDEADAEELRWYLEDYLRAPYGVYQERGERAAARLAEWGRAAFKAVIDGSRAARDAYVRLRDRGGVAEVIVRSAVAERLGLPWELLTDPARPTPLALDGVRVRRALPTADLAGTFAVGGERLRVLMVISRPAGQDDVGYRMVARPLLQRLEAVRGDVDLVVLRPPTLERLREVLAEARAAERPFQVVHFDGHGAFGDQRRTGWGAAVTLDDPSAQGVLVFERPGGGADRVPADRVAGVLAEARVPVVVLNACQSGALGRDVEAAVATRLLQQGAAAVVAMAFSVYAVAAAEFMAAFYDRLFAGGEVADAVAAGRLRLAERNTRPSPKGPLPLQDWLVPVLYARQDVSFPWLQRAPAAGSLDTLLDQVRLSPDAGDVSDPLAAVGAFVGRDGLFYELETAARLQKVVLLHGAAGTGKTELAKAFGRWWRDTGGVDQPQWVIWHSFEPGVASFGLPGVLNTVGMQVFGAAFAQLDDEQRRQAVLRLMREQRLLLIWDNFESVHSMPDPTGATPPLDAPERQRIADFLGAAATGASAVLITSRSTEDWLGEIRRIGVVGLGREEADEYTDALLAPYPRAAARRKPAAFAELMTWLGGHPLSMRVVLPHLDTTDAATILKDLRESGGELLGTDERGRTASLSAGIAYSYRHLTTDEQQALVALCLFHSTTDAEVLGAFSDQPEAPAQFRGRTAADWKGLLDRAANLGLLTAIGAGMYILHPALPAYLANRWQQQQHNAYPEQRAAAELALLEAYTGLARWLDQQIGGGDAGFALTVIHVQRHTLGAMLGHALTVAQHDAAFDIAMVLTRYWDTLGLNDEARAWTDRILQATESPDGSPPPLDTPAGALWLFMVGAQANRQATAHQLDAAERTYHQLMNMLSTQPDSPAISANLAGTYHQLGIVAELRGELATAERWHQQSLTISQQLGDRLGMASSYHQLGRVAQERGDLGTAERWYQQSLNIKAQIGDRPGVAGTYHQLGIVAELRGDLGTAERWHQQSLTIKEQLGNRPGMATSYHQLGVVAELRGDLGTAERWYKQSLTIEEQLGNRPGMATSYHQLGTVTQLRGDLGAAERWYQQSLTINEQLGNRLGLALTYAHLGVLAEAQGATEDALTWTIRSVSLFDTFPHPSTDVAPHHLAYLTADLGWDALRAGWREVTGQELPAAVIDYIQAIHDEGT